MLTGLKHPEACFLSRIKAFIIEHRGYKDLRRATEGGHDAAAYLYAILLYRDNGGAVADDTANMYMRLVAGGGSTTSRWLNNEGCLPLCEKVTHALHYSTWCIWGEPVPLHRCAVIRRARAMTVAAAWKRMASNFSVLQRRL
jgi:hypothetical protein